MILLSIAACTPYESAYERSVYDYEPIYCYGTIGNVDCRREPDRRDAARLVNYYGPAPGKYAPRPPPKQSNQRPPPAATADSGFESSRQSATDDAAHAGTVPADRVTNVNDKSEWREWLPLASVAFGALQAIGMFLF